MFVDPYGELASQLSYTALRQFVTRRRVDIMMNVFTTYLARALSSISNIEVLKRHIKRLFGPRFCEGVCPAAKEICLIGEATASSVLEAYKCMLESLGYTRIEALPVHFHRGVLYYMVLATRGSGEWISGYLDYINTRAPKDYETLKKLWLTATGRIKQLDNFLKG
jgi:hypothetical protein